MTPKLMEAVYRCGSGKILRDDLVGLGGARMYLPVWIKVIMAIEKNGGNGKEVDVLLVGICRGVRKGVRDGDLDVIAVWNVVVDRLLAVIKGQEEASWKVLKEVAGILGDVGVFCRGTQWN